MFHMWHTSKGEDWVVETWEPTKSRFECVTEKKLSYWKFQGIGKIIYSVIKITKNYD